jgi:pimeloyl-ACP methyl ester carboxylesterase
VPDHGVIAVAFDIDEASKPSWYLIAKDDRMIPPPAQAAMSKRAGAKVTEVNGSHSVYVSNAEAVAKIIRQAAESLKQAK